MAVEVSLTVCPQMFHWEYSNTRQSALALTVTVCATRVGSLHGVYSHHDILQLNILPLQMVLYQSSRAVYQGREILDCVVREFSVE